MRPFACLVLLAACAPKGPASAEDGAAPTPQIILYGVKLHSFKGSELFVSGRAAKVTYQRSGADFDALEAQLRFPHAQGRELELRAPVAQGNLETRQTVGSGGVVLRTGAGLVGTTPSARFDGRASTASGTDWVRVTGEGYALTSHGFALDLKSEEFTFRNGVDSRFGAPEAKR